MEKTTKKARLDREQLQTELDELTGRSKGDAKRATEVGFVLLDWIGLGWVGLVCHVICLVWFGFLRRRTALARIKRSSTQLAQLGSTAAVHFESRNQRETTVLLL